MGESEALPVIPQVIKPNQITCNANTGEVIMDSMNPGQPLYTFRPESEITEEQRDPDYALKQLEKLNGGRYIITCSKCHHCR